MEHVVQDVNCKDITHARREYGEWIIQAWNEPDHEMIFIDESAFNLWLSRTRGRARQGGRAVRIVGDSRCSKGANFTLILAVSNTRGHIHHAVFHGGTNADHFNNWLRRVSEVAGNGDVTFVLDNVPCHRRWRE